MKFSDIHKKNKANQEIQFLPKTLKLFKKKEIIIRCVGIILIAFIYGLFEFDFALHNKTFFFNFIINIVFVFIMWNGSMLIIEHSLKVISVFKHPVKLITSQLFFLSSLVIIIEIAFSYFKCVLHLNPQPTAKVLLFNIFLSWIITFLISFIYASISFFIQWKANLLMAKEYEKATIQAQYETLKNQINPHFLFNSLNTLLYLVQDNPNAARYVESLSEFMRFILQNRSKEAVLLKDELNMTKEYIYIQKARFGDKFNVSFDIPKKNQQQAIPPLALQMLIENSIKHNTISNELPLEVRVYTTDDNYLVVENQLNERLEKEHSTGLGLNNIRNRYLYLTGKEIKIENKNGKFIVFIPLVELNDETLMIYNRKC